MKRQLDNGKWAEALRPGIFTDFSGVQRTFTPEDISKIADGVKNQIASGYNPPMVKGHPTTDSPRTASIVDAKVGDNNILMVKLDKIEPKFAEEVKNGEYPYVSVALYKDYSKGLRHLGALGGFAPAVKGLQPLAFGEGMFAEQDKDLKPEDVICFAEPFENDIKYAFRTLGRIFRKQREMLIEKESVEAANEIYPEWDIKIFEDFETPTEESLGGTAALAEGGSDAQRKPDNGCSDSCLENPESDELKKTNEALRAEVEALKAENAKKESEAKKNAFAEKLNALAKEGKLRAPQRENAEKIFELLGGGSLSFAEGEDAAENLLKILEANEPLVKSGEYNFAESGSETGSVEQARAEIQKLVNEGLTYSDAAKKLSKGRQ